jgi:hypothetical protein
LEGPTAEWYFDCRRELAAAGGSEAPPSFEACIRDEHAGIHSFAEMWRALEESFELRLLEWVPYLYEELGSAVSEAAERALIESGAIQATGFRYVGETARSA